MAKPLPDIDSGDSTEVRKVCEFIDVALQKPRAISEIENAVALSFVEAREFRKTELGRSTLLHMPERVRQIVLEQERCESEVR